MKRILTIAILMLTAILSVSAQDTNTASGSIRDAFLKTPLPDVKLTLMTEDSTFIKNVEVVKATKASTGEIEYTMFYTAVECGKKYLLRGSQEGYDDAWLSFQAPMGKGVQFDAGNLELRKARNLKEVTVTATKVKMFWKGDTLVYNADAFQLPDGSMLDDLVRQLPGVTLKDNGEIFVNGRKVDELLLGARSFFRGNSKVLLENLPYYTVKNLKVYEKQSDRSKALGFDVDPRKYVMDVNLKQEYNKGIISNIEMAGGTQGRYLGRGFLLGFADPYRFTLLGNLNNVNESRHIGKENQWTPASAPQSLLTTRSVAGEFSFRSTNQKYEENLNIDYKWSKDESEVRKRSELFLSGATPLTLTQSSAMNKASKLSLHNNFKFLKPHFLYIDFDYNRSTHSGNTSLLTEQFNDTLTNRLHDFAMSQGNQWDFHTNWSGTLKINPKNEQYINYYFDFTRTKEANKQMKRYDFDFCKTCKSKPHATPQHNVSDFWRSSTETYTWLTYGVDTKSKKWIHVDEEFRTKNERTHDWLYHPDTLMLPSQQDMLMAITDISNSYDSHFRMQQSITVFNISQIKYLSGEQSHVGMRYDYIPWRLNLRVGPERQSLDYQRGTLDTLATNTSWIFQPSLRGELFPTHDRKHEIDYSISHTMTGPSIHDRITYRDDSQPLVVKLGNPNLKGNQTTTLKAEYYNRYGAHQRMYHISSSIQYLHRAIGQAVIYAPTTGVYTYRPENVSGNYNTNVKLDFSQNLDEKRYWSMKTGADANFHHSVDQALLAGETTSHLNQVNTLTLHNGTSVQYDHNKLNLRASYDISWRHSEGKMLDFDVLNAFDYQYGLSGRYTIPGINMTVSADANMYSRRGYGSSNLNTDDFVLNASLSQPFLKGKLIARIEAFDLLHQLSNTQYAVNAQGRTITWYRSLPHYAMLHLVYHWNKNPKKK